MSSDFAHAICKISVAHLISQSGFDKSSSQACDLLTEILDRYLIHLVARCKGFAEMGQGDPNEINAVDVSKAFESMRLDFTKLEEFLGTWKLAKAKTATKGAIHLDRAEEPDVPSASALAREPPAFPRLEPASFPINLELALCKERRLPPSLAAYLLQDESDGRCPSSHHPGADDSAITTASIPPHFPPFPDIGSLEPCPTSPSKTLRSSSTQESTPPAEPSASSDPHTHYPAADQDPNRKQALSLANPYSHTIPFSGSQLCSFGRLYERTTPTPLNSFSTQPSTATVYLSQLLETAILASSRPQPSRAVLPNATACRLLDHRATSGTGIGDECTIFGADGGTAEKGVLHELLKSSALPYIPQLLLEHPPAPLSKSSKAKKTKEAAKPSAVPIIAAAPLVIPPLSPPPIQAVKRKDSDFSASSPPPPAKEKKKKRKDSIGVAKGDPASTGALGHSSKPGDSAESVLLGKKPGFSDALEMQPSARAMEPIYTNDDLDGLASGSMAPKIKLRLNVAKSSSTTASREGDADMLFSDPFQPATNGEADSQEAAVPNRPAATISLLGRPVRADPTTMHPMYMKENDVPRNAMIYPTPGTAPR
ncbi:uncharacterized protein BJ171DRAFT_154317 [Polychytrium aggregatum]|uniref:uncharacterized protein n=1 Tax=Polychytrium aggregatum TaxID=110093 RepID=UPI0022FE3B94|nr:uncharacterized protein BJ171DRAFT_154317 [Polychytrium aggregatum]KAI9203181.1 hypothetical protein BJ171DRAFT_154317 [Polychytrium aggregatum]